MKTYLTNLTTDYAIVPLLLALVFVPIGVSALALSLGKLLERKTNALPPGPIKF